jgi:hypothetical protein
MTENFGVREEYLQAIRQKKAQQKTREENII